jgi:hypothetical protein
MQKWQSIYFYLDFATMGDSVAVRSYIEHIREKGKDNEFYDKFEELYLEIFEDKKPFYKYKG